MSLLGTGRGCQQREDNHQARASKSVESITRSQSQAPSFEDIHLASIPHVVVLLLSGTLSQGFEQALIVCLVPDFTGVFVRPLQVLPEDLGDLLGLFDTTVLRRY